ncbi:MAG: hypothetical protein R2705_12280 [Ilumatobacteraceae bacterium]
MYQHPVVLSQMVADRHEQLRRDAGHSRLRRLAKPPPRDMKRVRRPR